LTRPGHGERGDDQGQADRVHPVQHHVEPAGREQGQRDVRGAAAGGDAHPGTSSTPSSSASPSSPPSATATSSPSPGRDRSSAFATPPSVCVLVLFRDYKT